MSWRRIKCSACGDKMAIGLETFNRLVRENQQVGCLVEHCVGTMHPSGKLITRRTTADAGLLYEFQVARRDVSRKRALVNYADASDDEDQMPDAKRRKTRESEDEAWAPAEQYTPAMRFTTHDMETNLRLGPPSGLTLKQLSCTRITAALPGERQKSTKSPMGAAAWRHAQKFGAPNAGSFTLGSRDHYEWCHLQAVSLGGSTIAANLVAAHYALNTYMSVVEEHLRGKTHLEVGIDVYCTHADVADYIVYSVYRATDRKCLISLNMDGRMTCFSVADRERVKARLKQACG